MLLNIELKKIIFEKYWGILKFFTLNIDFYLYYMILIFFFLIFFIFFFDI